MLGSTVIHCFPQFRCSLPLSVLMRRAWPLLPFLLLGWIGTHALNLLVTCCCEYKPGPYSTSLPERQSSTGVKSFSGLRFGLVLGAGLDKKN